MGASLWEPFGDPENAWMSSINGTDEIFLFVLKLFGAIWGVPLGTGFGTILGLFLGALFGASFLGVLKMPGCLQLGRFAASL